MSRLCLALLLLFLLVQCTVSRDPPETSPVPPPETGGESPFSPPDTGAPAPSPGISSPPAPPKSDIAPGSSLSPAPSPSTSAVPSPSPSPSEPSDAGETNHEISNKSAEDSTSSSGGLKGGQKAGIAVAVIAVACMVGFGGMVYKKRRDNIRRSEFGYAARREIL